MISFLRQGTIALCLTLLTLCLVACRQGHDRENGDTNADTDRKETQQAVTISLIEPKNGATEVQITNDLVLSYLKLPFAMDACDPFFDLERDKFQPAEIVFSWEGKADTLYLATDEAFADPWSYPVSGNTLTLDGLMGNTTYYWKVTGEEGTSEVFSFTTAATPRTVNIDGVTNTRDMGGWQTEDGQVLKQGIVYRTATLDKITEEGIAYCRDVLRIRTELDLRKADEGNAGVSPLGEDVNYIQISSPYYGASVGNIYDPANYEALRQILQVFADPDNYPILFHCTVGRDRTGTVAFVLQALCGMGRDAIFQEYDLSLFSANGDHKPSVMHKNFFVPLYRGMAQRGDGTLQENTVQYCLEIGLTMEEIDAIRANLLANR